MTMPFAFRCKKCGHLESSAHAGVNGVPHACSVCGAGVTFSVKGVKSHQSDNWQVLSTLTEAQLAEYGLTLADVEKHAPDHEKIRLHNLQRAEDALAWLKKKKQVWEAKSHAEWQADLYTLEEKARQLDALPVDSNDVEGHAKQMHEKECCRQEIAALVACEWTARDDAHQAELEGCIAKEGHPPQRKAKSIFAYATEGVKGRSVSTVK